MTRPNAAVAAGKASNGRVRTRPATVGEIKRGSPAESLLEFQLMAIGITGFERQYRYAKPRKLTADFAWPESRLLVEVQGGIWGRKAHGSITGILADIDRLNAATLAGWRLLRVTPDMVKNGGALQVIERALA